MIERGDDNGIVTLRLAHGKASALDLELMEALARVMAEIALSDARAVVMTGSGSIFSAGVDLFRLVQSGEEYVDRFVPALSRLVLDLFTFPKPLVMAVNGHAIAGGCVFTLTGDYRIMAAGNGRIGVPELLVGVPFPPTVLEIIRFAVPPQHVQSLVYTGRTVKPEDALTLGLVDEVTAPEELLSRATQVATQLASLPPEAFRLTKRQLRDKAVDWAKHFANELDATMHDLWKGNDAHGRIREYLAKTVKR